MAQRAGVDRVRDHQAPVDAAVAAVEEDRRAVEPRGVRRRRQPVPGADAGGAGPHSAREVGLDPAPGAGLQGVADPGRRRPPLTRRLRPGDRDPSQAPAREGAVGDRRVGRDRRQGDRLRRPLLDRRPGAAEPATAVDGAPVRAGVVARSAARGVGPRDAAADLRRRHRSRGAAAGGARRSGGGGAGRSADDRADARRDAPRSPCAQGHRQHPLLPRRRVAREVRRRRRRGEWRGRTTDAAKQTPEAAAAQAATDGKPAAAGSDGVVRTPLITTTASGSTIEIFPGFGGEGAGLYYTDLNNAAKMRDQYRPGQTPQVLAWQISGKLPSAFPTGRRAAVDCAAAARRAARWHRAAAAGRHRDHPQGPGRRGRSPRHHRHRLLRRRSDLRSARRSSATSSASSTPPTTTTRCCSTRSITCSAIRS